MKSDKPPQLRFDDVSLVYVRCLRILGLMPFEGRDFRFLGSRVLVCYFVCSCTANWSMFIGHMCNTKAATVDGMIELMLVMGQSVRFYLIAGRRASLWAMIEECRAIWSECCDERGHRTVLAYERKVRRLMYLLAGSFFSATFLYTGSTLAQNAHAERKLLPYKWFVENVEDQWPGYWITFLVQQTIVYSFAVVATVCDTVLPLLMMLAAGYFRHLADHFNSHDRSSYGGDDELIDDSFHYDQFIRYATFHQRLLRFCAQLEQFCRMVFLVQILTTGYNLSLIGIKLIGSDPDKLKYLPLILVSSCQLLLCQWAPDNLYDESSRIAKAAYCSSRSWITEPRIGKLLIVVIAKAQQPVQMTAGGFVNLSLEKFGSMMTSAFSFFAVLRNFNL